MKEKEPQRIQGFVIKRQIGKGGMGTIYHALDTSLNREVVLKEIHSHLSENSGLMDRFKIEAMTQARMNHPNIVTVHSFIEREGKGVIVMEYVKGQSLKECLESRGVLSVPVAIRYMKQILEALRYAHKKNVIHRDIKPGNILISSEGAIKISDFGIVKIFGSQSMTKTGMLIGTPWYTSPEQILGEPVDFRTDLYSAGITFYEMLTGKLPFQTDTNSDFQVQQAHLETPPIRPSIFNSEIGTKVEKFILRALAKKKKKRFQTAEEMLVELEYIQQNINRHTAVEGGEGTRQVLRSGSYRSKTRILLFAFFGLLILAGGYWLVDRTILGRDTSSPPGDTTDPKVAISPSSTQKPATQETQKPSAEAKAPDESSVENLESATENQEEKKKNISDKESKAQTSPTIYETQSPPAKKDIRPVTASPRPPTDSKGSGKDKQKPADSASQVRETDTKASSLAPNKEKTAGKKSSDESRPSDNPPAGTPSPPPESANTPNMEEEVFLINSKIASNQLSAAEERIHALLEKKRTPVILVLAGKIHYLKGELETTLDFWKEAVELGGIIKIRIYYRFRKDSQRLGFLIMKKGRVQLKTRFARHDIILPHSRVTLLEVDNRGISLGGRVGGMPRRVTLNSTVSENRNRKERFLKYFLENHILVSQ